jgi:hypothetical protein
MIRLTPMALIALVLLAVLPQVATAAPTVRMPAKVKQGHGFVISGSGFPARSFVRIGIGKPRSELFHVVRLRTTRRGTFRSVQRVVIPGRWFWVFQSSAPRVSRVTSVTPGARAATQPAAVTAGTPFDVNTRGIRGFTRIQAQAPGTSTWRTVGGVRAANAGATTFVVPSDNPVFNPQTRVGDWRLRACSNLCRVGVPATVVAFTSIRIGEP